MTRRMGTSSYTSETGRNRAVGVIWYLGLNYWLSGRVAFKIASESSNVRDQALVISS
jgi:hypothetical protein